MVSLKCKCWCPRPTTGHKLTLGHLHPSTDWAGRQILGILTNAGMTVALMSQMEECHPNLIRHRYHQIPGN